MKQDQVDEIKTYNTPELKKIGTVKELTQGNGVHDPSAEPGP